MDTTLVTGSTGLVGYHIVQALVQRGRPVKALVRSIDKAKALLPESRELVQGDMEADPSLRGSSGNTRLSKLIVKIAESSRLWEITTIHPS